MNTEQEKEFKEILGHQIVSDLFWIKRIKEPMEKFIAKILKAQREKLSKTFDKTIGTKFEIAENNFKAGQKKERENMIKEALETFKKLKKTAEMSGESMFLWEMENQIKALKDNE